MSARVYFMKTVNGCKDVSIMSPQDEQWRRTSLLFLYTAIFLFYLSKTVCSQNINKQNVNIADETYTDYSFLSMYHYTKSKNYLRRRYRIRHWIPMFIGTPCIVYNIFPHITSSRKLVCSVCVISSLWSLVGRKSSHLCYFFSMISSKKPVCPVCVFLLYDIWQEGSLSRLCYFFSMISSRKLFYHVCVIFSLLCIVGSLFVLSVFFLPYDL